MHRPHVPLEDKADDTYEFLNTYNMNSCIVVLSSIFCSNNCSENGVKEYNAEVRLLMMQFNIGEMCLDVQSRGGVLQAG